MQVSTAALYTLTALTIGDLAQQAVTHSAVAAPELTPTENAVSKVESHPVKLVSPVAAPETVSVETIAVEAIVAETIVAETIAVETRTAPGADSSGQPPEAYLKAEAVEVETAVNVATAPTASIGTIAPPDRFDMMPESGFTTAEALWHPERFLAAVVSEPSLHAGTQLMPAIQLLAQAPSQNEIEELQRRLLEGSTTESDFGDEYAGSPALTISNPSGFGADRLRAFISGTLQADKRRETGADGSIGFGIGLGDAQRAVGLQVSYTMASFGTNSRDFGSGGFNAKLHRQIADGLSVAIGWEGFVTFGEQVDFEDTLYAAATQVIRTRPNIRDLFSRIALTAGVGNGRFRSESDFDNDVNAFNPFGSIAVRIAQPVSAVLEWTGQDLSAGLSIVPFKNIPFTITPAVRDLAGAGDRPRFVLGAGVSFQL